MKLTTTVNKVAVEIELPGVSERVYVSAKKHLDRLLADSSIKNRQVICDIFLFLLGECPTANPSDLWHHIVYRSYCEILPNHRPQDPGQSWVRASGDALEMALQALYTPVLGSHHVRIEVLISRRARRAALHAMDLGAEVGHSKLDMVLSLKAKKNRWLVFGGVDLAPIFGPVIM